MSLINDALKRAKAVHEQMPPPPPSHFPPLRPADPQQAVRRGIGLVVPIAFGLVALLTLFFVWRFANDTGAGEQETLAVHASTGNLSAPPGPAPEPIAAPVSQTPQSNSASPAAVPATAAAAVPTPSALPAGAATAAPQSDATHSAPVPASAASSNGALPGPPCPQPAPLRLQGIIYHPTRPSAVLSGKIVFLGDRVQGFRVASISPETVTLVGVGVTNVLSLPD